MHAYYELFIHLLSNSLLMQLNATVTASAAEDSTVVRLGQCFEDLNCVNIY